MARWEDITKQQFQLSYFGTIPYDVTNELPVHERLRLFDLLKEQKNEEKQAHEEAAKKIKASRATPKHSHHRARRRR